MTGKIEEFVNVPDEEPCKGHPNDGSEFMGITCKQCDGRHSHKWVPTYHVTAPRRCEVCYAWACGVSRKGSNCTLRFLHREPHALEDGSYMAQTVESG